MQAPHWHTMVALELVSVMMEIKRSGRGLDLTCMNTENYLINRSSFSWVLHKVSVAGL